MLVVPSEREGMVLARSEERVNIRTTRTDKTAMTKALPRMITASGITYSAVNIRSSGVAAPLRDKTAPEKPGARSLSTNGVTG